MVVAAVAAVAAAAATASVVAATYAATDTASLDILLCRRYFQNVRSYITLKFNFRTSVHSPFFYDSVPSQILIRNLNSVSQLTQ